MAEGCIYIYTGDGRGKSPAAIGRAVQAAVEGKRVVIIQFLKGKGLGDSDFLRRMEPEIKLFRFEKSDGNFVELPEEKKQEEIRLEALKTKKERLEIRQKELDKRYKEAGERCRIAENNDIFRGVRESIQALERQIEKLNEEKEKQAKYQEMMKQVQSQLENLKK